MKKLLTLIAFVVCFGSQAWAADTTFVSDAVYQTGDCTPCSMTDSEYYLLTGTTAGSSTDMLPGTSMPLTVIDRTTGTRIPALLTAPGPEMYHYTYLGPDMAIMSDMATNDDGDSIWMYSHSPLPSTVTVGGYSVQVNPNNRFRILNRHYAPTRTAAVVPAGSVTTETAFSRDALPTNFGSGVKARSIPPAPDDQLASDKQEQ